MATTYALPTMNGHGGHGHSHSHGRKSATERLPLRPTSTNGGLQASSGPISSDLLKPEMQHQPHKSIDVFYDSNQLSYNSNQQRPNSLQLPTPPSFSTPTSARSKSMERRKSVGLPTHLRLERNGYGFPPPSSQQFPKIDEEVGLSSKWTTIGEFLNSILVPLPYVLASLAFTSLVTPRVSPGGLPLSTFTAPEVPVLLETSTLTSLTLILVGVRGKLGTMSATALDKRRKSLAGMEEVQRTPWIQMARRIAARFLTVGLPFYATSKLGGARVALVMLLALASNIMTIEEETTDLTQAKGWRRLLTQRRWTLVSILLQVVSDLTGFTNSSAAVETVLGYITLGTSVFVLPPCFMSSRPRVSVVTSTAPASESKTSAVLATPWEIPPQLEDKSSKVPTISPMICSPEDVELTFYSGVGLAMLSTIVFIFSGPSAGTASKYQLAWSLLSTFATALALTTADPRSLRGNKKLGLVLGSLLSSLVLTMLCSEAWSLLACQSIFIGISFAAMKFDTHTAFSISARSDHDQRQHQPTRLNIPEHAQMSKFSEFVIQRIPHWPLLHSILGEKDSRRIFYFMCLNFVFMIVQTFYGIMTGSLGLLSDSIHMFFDCLALVVGLCAAVMSKWPPSTRFPYGYGKMDTLAGFANGIFLMLISVEIVYEALERLAGGNQIHNLGELLTVSTLGLVVNIIGMTAFGHAHHGHGHSHGGHDHSDHSHAGHQHENGNPHDDHPHHDHAHHDHSHHDHTHNDHCHHDHSPPRHEHQPHSAHNQDHLHDHLHTGPALSPSLYSSVPPTPSKPLNPVSHAHGHGSHGHGHHHHGNENMHGIFLHVMADTLGSVAVVISTILIHFYGWSGFDPLASCLIAILIFASAIPLVTSSARTLLLTIPEDTEYDLREALAGLSSLRGVVGYAVPKFWLEEGENRKVLGVIHVIAGKGAELEDVKERAIAFLKSKHMDVVVQVEREGSGRCWCQAVK